MVLGAAPWSWGMVWGYPLGRHPHCFALCSCFLHPQRRSFFNTTLLQQAPTPNNTLCPSGVTRRSPPPPPCCFASLPPHRRGSFNTMPLQQGYQSSRFTRICRDVSAMYSDSSRATSNNLPSPQAMQMAAQMEAFNMGSGASSGMMQGMGMGGSGTSTGGMGMASGGSGMNLPMGPPPPRHGMGSGQGQGLQQVPPSIAHGMVPMDL